MGGGGSGVCLHRTVVMAYETLNSLPMRYIQDATLSYFVFVLIKTRHLNNSLNIGLNHGAVWWAQLILQALHS